MTTLTKEPVRLIHRSQLQRRLAGLKTPAEGPSPGEVVRDLTTTGSLWWDCCKEAVADDPHWLTGDEASAVLALISAHASGTADERRAVMVAATMTLLVAQALGASDQERPAVLERVVEQWSTAGVLPPRPGGAGLLGREGVVAADRPLQPRLESLIRTLERLGDDPVRAMAALTGLRLAKQEKRPRYTVRMSVVFGTPGDNGAEKGAAGILELWEYPGGPAGLFPDPRTMAGIRADGSFEEALAVAWNASPGRRGGRCVLWRIVVNGAAVPSVEGPSLGAAFALALRELLRRPASHRPSLAAVRGFLRGPRPRTAVTGAIDDQGRLTHVGAIEDKFEAAHRKGWRLVAPQENQSDLASTRDPAAIVFAHDLKEAGRLARRWRTGRALMALAVVLLPAAAGYGVYRYTVTDTPRLRAEVNTQAGAAAYEAFVRSHERQVVYLDVRCESYTSDAHQIDPRSHCWFQEMDNYSDESPKAFYLTTFSHAVTAYEWWNGPGHDSWAGHGILFSYFPQKPTGSSTFFSQNNGDGSSGAGGLEAKGYFEIVISGTGSLGPTGVDVAELRPRTAPS
ncbi:hypothetical protein [Nonomuraea sp. NPDC050786]|uniref:hypothetical protein n=1 Tax=Nonomuraea sp. NPDC050786 TaxID=3154840 RepID=UPI0033CCA01C